MDKIKLTNHIKDIELKNKMFKVIDKINSVLKNYEVKKTEFLNPHEIKNAISILNAYDDIKYHIDGGYENAERSIIVIYPYYMEESDLDDEVEFLQIDGNFKFNSVSHRDYLGALLNLGIKREKIGDILIQEDYCQLVVDKDISDFILIRLERVSKNNIKVKQISRLDIKESHNDYKDINFTISSDRLDCIISGVYNLSRQDSVKFINNEKVYVNYEKITNISKSISNESLISVRGKGRFIIDEIGDITKKGKIKVKAKIIL